MDGHDQVNARMAMILTLRRVGYDHAQAVSMLDAYDAIRRKVVLAEAAAELDAASILPGPQHAAALLRDLASRPRP